MQAVDEPPGGDSGQPEEPRTSLLDARTSNPVNDSVTPMPPPSDSHPAPAARNSPAAAPAPPVVVEVLSGEDGKKFAGVSRRKQEQQEVAQAQQAAKLRSKYMDRAQEMIDIPELEEEGKEDLTRVVRPLRCIE